MCQGRLFTVVPPWFALSDRKKPPMTITESPCPIKDRSKLVFNCFLIKRSHHIRFCRTALFSGIILQSTRLVNAFSFSINLLYAFLFLLQVAFLSAAAMLVLLAASARTRIVTSDLLAYNNSARLLLFQIQTLLCLCVKNLIPHRKIV